MEKREMEPEKISKGLSDGEIAVRYQLFHALAILALLHPSSSRNSWLIQLSGWLLLLGILLFSGGLYSIALFDTIGNPMIAPAGGITLMVGWAVAAIGFLTCRFPNIKPSKS